MTCTKRRYASVSSARKAHKRAAHRIRAYACGECGGVHVTNGDKTPPLAPRQRVTARRGGYHPEAPVLTLAEVQALAEQKRRLA